jgi:hypothetical protein
MPKIVSTPIHIGTCKGKARMMPIATIGPMPDSPTDTLRISIRGRDIECRVVWAQIDGEHIVAQEPNGRQLIAKRRLGAWSEISMATVAAKLNHKFKD